MLALEVQCSALGNGVCDVLGSYLEPEGQGLRYQQLQHLHVCGAVRRAAGGCATHLVFRQKLTRARRQGSAKNTACERRWGECMDWVSHHAGAGAMLQVRV